MGEMRTPRPSQSAQQRSQHVGHYHQDDADQYIGRGEGGDAHLLNTAPEHSGGFGNPFKLEDYTRAESIALFAYNLCDQLVTRPSLIDAVADLSGQTLACFCRSQDDDDPACHGDVLAAWADHLADPTGTTVAVAGSRTLYDRFHDQLDGYEAISQLVSNALEQVRHDNDDLDANPIDAVIHGDNADSPDRWGEVYAEQHPGISNVERPPNWDVFDSGAGYYKRNSVVVADALTYENRHLLAFHDGDSNGTQDTIDKARRVGIPVTTINLSDEATRHDFITPSMIDL